MTAEEKSERIRSTIRYYQDLLGSRAETPRGILRAWIKNPRTTPNVEPIHFTYQQLMSQRYERRASRIAAALGLWDLDVAEELARELSRGDLPSTWRLRTTRSPAGWELHAAWGYGTVLVDVEIEFGCYSRRCRYPARAQDIYYYPTRRSVIACPGLLVRGRFPILDAEPTAVEGIFRVRYVVQARGLDVREEAGYYHPATRTLRRARSAEALMRRLVRKRLIEKS